ncbi:GTP cyclohydrolase II [Neptunomonas concharum]|uniref:GTP cyclohydrolase-2 n=1 Tax=Neptunomonas concharum TaxID=1031538 RepID=A0A5P1R7E2_9GAMM|nr:GTP cyclohydrolase II [Neptunomonas concharum]QEQ95560.1 GTP cyclohydrolase II [Neptunomonas concharum]
MTIEYVADSKLPMPWGTFTMVGFEDTETGKEHIAMVYGDVSGDAPVLARIHSECLTGDALFSLRCDCGFQLQEALKRIAENGRGVLLYLRQEGRGIGLLNKIKAYHLQDQGADTVEANEQLGFEADMRDYSMCEPMLEHLKIKAVNLMTNNPRKVAALEKYGVNVAQRVPLQVGKNRHNEEYLATKMGKLGHMMTEHHFMDDK